MEKDGTMSDHAEEGATTNQSMDVEESRVAASGNSNNELKRRRDDAEECDPSADADATTTKRVKRDAIPTGVPTNSERKDDDNNNDSKETTADTSPSGEATISTKSTAPVFSPALTRRRSAENQGEKEKAASTDKGQKGELHPTGYNNKGPSINGRWRVHQMAEDYIGLAGQMMYPATKLRTYGYDPSKREYPLEGISVLGFLKSPLRRPTIIEKWSPYEIAMFEGAVLHHGKEFHLVSREIGSKSTKEVIDFYYQWKKTAHYVQWKDQFMSDLDVELLEPQTPVKKKGI